MIVYFIQLVTCHSLFVNLCPQSSFVFHVAENVAQGAPVGRVTATDPDQGANAIIYFVIHGVL